MTLPATETDPCPRCKRKMLNWRPGLVVLACCWCGWEMELGALVLAIAKADKARGERIKRAYQESDMDERIREAAK